MEPPLKIDDLGVPLLLRKPPFHLEEMYGGDVQNHQLLNWDIYQAEWAAFWGPAGRLLIHR